MELDKIASEVRKRNHLLSPKTSLIMGRKVKMACLRRERTEDVEKVQKEKLG